MHLRHKPNLQPAEPLAVQVTEIRPDDYRRDEKLRPETVVHHVPLWDGITRDAAFERAAVVASAIAPAARDRYRVKVVAR